MRDQSNATRFFILSKIILDAFAHPLWGWFDLFEVVCQGEIILVCNSEMLLGDGLSGVLGVECEYVS